MMARRFAASAARRAEGCLVTSARLEKVGAHWAVHVWLHSQLAGHLLCHSEDEGAALANGALLLDEVLDDVP